MILFIIYISSPYLTITYYTYYTPYFNLLIFLFIIKQITIIFNCYIFCFSFIVIFIIYSIFILILILTIIFTFNFIAISISILFLFTLYCIILFYINILFLLFISSILSILPFYCCMRNFLVYIASKNCSMRNFFFKTFVSITTFYYLCSRRYNINNTIYYIMTFITS